MYEYLPPHNTSANLIPQKARTYHPRDIATYVCCCQLSSKSRWWVGEGLVLNQPYITTFGIHSRTPYGYVQYNPPVGMSNEPSGAQLEPATISLNSSVQTRSSILGKSHFVTWLFFSSVDKQMRTKSELGLAVTKISLTETRHRVMYSTTMDLLDDAYSKRTMGPSSCFFLLFFS